VASGQEPRTSATAASTWFLDGPSWSTFVPPGPSTMIEGASTRNPYSAASF